MTRSHAGGEVRVLGPLEIVVGGRPARLRPAQRRLLATLLLEPAATLDRDTLIDRMWGEEVPPTATAALQVHLSGIRAAAPGLVVTRSGGYGPDLDAYRLDRTEFERLASRAASEAAAGAWDQVARTAARARSAWRGVPYPELLDDEFADPARARLVALWEEVTDLHARALLEARRPQEAVVELREQVQRHPLREPLWEHLMVALYRSGRPAEALQAYQAARRHLAAELGVDPGPGLRDLEDRILRGDESLGEPDRPPEPTNLPVLATSFVGRDEDLPALRDMLMEHRLVTVVGEPGIGKTRVAIELGHLVRHGHPDGTWFVPLAGARSERDVAAAIARAVGHGSHTVSLAELAERLAARRALLILDNCEHVIGPVADIAGRISGRPGAVRVLATSRRALGLAGEAAWRVAPLRTPSASPRSVRVDRGLDAPAVRMFVDRARAADRGFRLTKANAPLVAALCRRADGIPLALELAAAWVPALGLADIEAMLGGDEAPGRDGPARPTRHRSLLAALEWSIALLPPGDRDLFQSVSVFRGTFGLDDVLGVCAVGRERRPTAAIVARLVDASLVVAERREDGRVKYRLLAPIREFARERMELDAGWPALRDRFVGHYLDKARAAAPDPLRAVTDLGAVDDDLDNLREAFALGLDGGRADEVALAVISLDGYFLNRFLGLEERDWLLRALPGVSDRATRARALVSAGLAAQATNDLDEALRLLEEALVDLRGLGDRPGITRCLLALAGLHANRGAWEAGAEAAREGRTLAVEQGSASGLGIAAYYHGTNLAYAGRTAEGIAALEEAAGHFEQAKEAGRAAQAMSTLVYLGVFGGDEALARRWADPAVELAGQSGSEARLARALSAAAALEARWGDPAIARDRLRRVDELLQAHANEDIFELLFPAGCLLRREEAWELLLGLVQSIEAAIAATGQGYAEPWRSAAAAWRREAGAQVPGCDHRRHEPPDGVPVARARVREYLAGTARGA